MKTVLLATTLYLSTSLKWDQLKVSPSARGEINTDEQYWTDFLSECDQQCTDQGGFVCGENQRQCCSSEDKCGIRFGMEVCRDLQDFECDPLEQSPYRLKPVLPPETYPQLSDLYE